MAGTDGIQLEAVPGGGAGEGRIIAQAIAPPVWIVRAGVERVSDEWQGATIQTSFWRIYQADAPGISLSWSGGSMAYPCEGLICIPGWLRYRFHWRRRVLHRYVHYEQVGWTREQVETCFPGPFLLPDRALGGELRRVSDAFAAPGACAQAALLAVQGLACRAHAAVVDGLAPAVRARLFPAGHGRFAQVLALIEEALHRPLAVGELAAAAGLRPQPFIRAFRRSHGTTPGQFIIERRLARACRLLQDPARGIEEVARACGFPGRHYFTRRFVRAMGVGPAAYRHRYIGWRRG